MANSFINKLIDKRLINIKAFIIDNYPLLGLDEKAAMMLIHVCNWYEKGNHFLSINELQQKMTLEFVECSNLVFRLVQKNLIAFDLKIDKNGKRKEMFSLDPLYQKMIQILYSEESISATGKSEETVSALITFIETEFARTLSAFEIEMIDVWINEEKFDNELIKLAIKESLLSSAYNLKYVDRVLLNWKANNIKTPQEARDYVKRFRKYTDSGKANAKEEEVYVSWMK